MRLKGVNLAITAIQLPNGVASIGRPKIDLFVLSGPGHLPVALWDRDSGPSLHPSSM